MATSWTFLITILLINSSNAIFNLFAGYESGPFKISAEKVELCKTVKNPYVKMNLTIDEGDYVGTTTTLRPIGPLEFTFSIYLPVEGGWHKALTQHEKYACTSCPRCMEYTTKKIFNFKSTEKCIIDKGIKTFRLSPDKMVHMPGFNIMMYGRVQVKIKVHAKKWILVWGITILKSEPINATAL